MQQLGQDLININRLTSPAPVEEDATLIAFKDFLTSENLTSLKKLCVALRVQEKGVMNKIDFMLRMEQVGFLNEQLRARNYDNCRRLFSIFHDVAGAPNGTDSIFVSSLSYLFSDMSKLHRTSARLNEALQKAMRDKSRDESQRQAAFDLHEHLAKVIARVKAAAYRAGGLDWATFFRQQDKKESGDLDCDEFLSMCRRVLKIDSPESVIKAIFGLLDSDHSGGIEIDELVGVMEPVLRMKKRLRECSGCQSRADWEKEIDTISPSQGLLFSFLDLVDLCRGRLQMTDVDAHFVFVFQHLCQPGASGFSATAFVDWMCSPDFSDPAASASQSKLQTTKAELFDKEVQDVYMKLRSAAKAAAYTTGGIDWTKLFREQDKDRSGMIDWQKFLSMCRRVLKLTAPEGLLRKMFSIIDGDGSGEIEIEELVAFMQEPKYRLRDRLTEVAGSDAWGSYLAQQDKSGSGRLDLSGFKRLVRKGLKLTMADADIKSMFDSIDAGRGGSTIGVEDIATFAAAPSEDRSESRPASPASPRPDRGLLRIDVEHHRAENVWHTQYSVDKYAEVAKALERASARALSEAGFEYEIRLNPGPPRGFEPYHGIQGWYHHSKEADRWMNDRWAKRPPKKIQYPRLGAFEVVVRLPNASNRAAGQFPGLPRQFEVFSKLKRKAWPNGEQLAKWLVLRLKQARGGSSEAVEQLLAAGQSPPSPSGPNEQVLDFEARWRRPKRNPPMWPSFSPRGAPAAPSVPLPKTSGRNPASIQAGVLPQLEVRAGCVSIAMINKVRARIKAASYTSGGRDFEKLLREQDKDHSGQISWLEFRHMCRKTMQIGAEDAQLFAVFKAVDFDGSGDIEIDELVAFIQDPVDRMRCRLRAAAEAHSGRNWIKFIEDQDEDGSGQIDFDEFRTMCRTVLKLPEGTAQLRQIFKHLDADGSGEVSLEELVDFLSNPSPPSAAEKQPPVSRPRPLNHLRRPKTNGESRGKREPATSPLELARADLKAAAVAMGKELWWQLFHDAVANRRRGRMSLADFEACCRGLGLTDAALPLQEEIFHHLTRGMRDVIAVEDLVNFLNTPVEGIENPPVHVERAGHVPVNRRPATARGAGLSRPSTH